MDRIIIEIGQYKEINKGALKASFSLVIHPQGQKILECRYFVQENKRWFSFPQKEVKYSDGRKTEYIPYVSYLNKEYLESLKTSTLEALKELEGKSNEGKKNQANNTKQNSLSTESSFDTERAPF